MAGNKQEPRVYFACVPLVVLFVLFVNPTGGEFNITFYNKGLTDGKIPNELAAIGGLESLQANNGISVANQGNINGFVQPEGESKAMNAPLPNDQGAAAVGSAIQNLTHFLGTAGQQNTMSMDGGFTEWTAWSKCPRSCGRTALRSRERYCTNPAPANGGKNCEGPRFQLKLCKLKECPVEGGYTAWTAWSRCTNKCGKGTKHRQRYCTNPAPLFGGKTCNGKKSEIKKCHEKMCNEDSIVDIDPQTVCGYNPCSVAKCISMPYATCVSDFKCKPVFFDSEERRVDGCQGTELYLTIDPETVCRFNPCKYTTCMTTKPAKCLVNTKCHPVFLDAFGKKLDCTGIFKVPARYICGHNPCSGVMCKAEPTARCSVDHTCKPVFVNSFKHTFKQCTERGQIMKGSDDDDDDGDQSETEQDEQVEPDDPLSRLMKGKHRKEKNDESETGNYETDSQEHKEEEVQREDGDYASVEEKKTNIKLPPRFKGA